MSFFFSKIFTINITIELAFSFVKLRVRRIEVKKNQRLCGVPLYLLHKYPQPPLQFTPF